MAAGQVTAVGLVYPLTNDLFEKPALAGFFCSIFELCSNCCFESDAVQILSNLLPNCELLRCSCWVSGA